MTNHELELTEAEALGLQVAAAYGTVMAERDLAREVGERLAAKFAEALTHLDAALAAVPEVASSFAHVNDEMAAARAFLEAETADAVVSTQTPEQEQT